MGLERCLRGLGCILFLPRVRIWFPAPTSSVHQIPINRALGLLWLPCSIWFKCHPPTQTHSLYRLTEQIIYLEIYAYRPMYASNNTYQGQKRTWIWKRVRRVIREEGEGRNDVNYSLKSTRNTFWSTRTSKKNNKSKDKIEQIAHKGWCWESCRWAYTVCPGWWLGCQGPVSTTLKPSHECYS